MKTRAEFEAEFADEFRGLLLRSFFEATRTSITQHAANGAAMYQQMKDGQALLGRIYEFLNEPLKASTTNGKAPRESSPVRSPGGQGTP